MESQGEICSRALHLLCVQTPLLPRYVCRSIVSWLQLSVRDADCADGIADLSEALTSNPNNGLTHIDFSGNKFRDRGAAALADGV